MSQVRHLLIALLLSLAAAAPSAARAENPASLRAALDAVPARYRSGILKISADDADPNPRTWYLLARDGQDNGRIHGILIADGQIIEEKPTFNLRAIIQNPTRIDGSRIRIDTDAAWLAAKNFAESKGRRLGSASYVIQQDGRDATPVWSIWCYDLKGDPFGSIRILTSNGAVIDSD